MLTFIKEILTWWNRQTFGTRLNTLFFGKFVGEDEFGNKYYENKKRKKRWVIYKDEIEATKIPVEWYSWMHSIKNKIEENHELKKNMIGSKIIYLIKQVQTKHTIHKKIRMQQKKI